MQHSTLRPHLHYTDTEGMLTPEGVMAGRTDGAPWIYMCGPPGMMKTFAKGFRDLGVPSRQIRWEQFDVR
jgi:predicted ferric reductase